MLTDTPESKSATSALFRLLPCSASALTRRTAFSPSPSLLESHQGCYDKGRYHRRDNENLRLRQLRDNHHPQPLKPVHSAPERLIADEIKDILVKKYSMHEVHSYIWCDKKKYKKLGIEVEDNVKILNIESSDNGVLRDSMLPTLLVAAYENKDFADSYGIFEIGRVVEAHTRKRLLQRAPPPRRCAVLEVAERARPLLQGGRSRQLLL